MKTLYALIRANCLVGGFELGDGTKFLLSFICQPMGRSAVNYYLLEFCPLTGLELPMKGGRHQG